MEGRIYQLNTKGRTPGGRGLPKSPVEAVHIGSDGLEGDYNYYRTKKLAGDTEQAVLLYPLEMIRTLNEEGWPVEPGDLGENVTTEGLAYQDFVAGGVYEVGEALLEVTKPCVPCSNLAALPYVGEARKKEFIKTLVNRRGWYARVLKEGRVRPGDRVERVSAN
ncbi:MAG TPA: MOSC domain-containing protein [Pyrinomonadaceae bacterium]|jgi:MOSC domain-containing protein YiiM